MYNQWNNAYMNGMYNPEMGIVQQGNYSTGRVNALTKKDIKEILTYNLGATETVSAQVGLQETVTRHICRGSNCIQQLSRNVYQIPTPQGSVINVNYFFCRCCGKLIIDDSSMEVF